MKARFLATLGKWHNLREKIPTRSSSSPMIDDEGASNMARPAKKTTASRRRPGRKIVRTQSAQLKKPLNFDALIDVIARVHEELQNRAAKAVNVSLTFRNWMIGYYIREYEQNGADRARYGEDVCEKLAKRLQAGLAKCYSGRYLRLCRQFYDAYPSIRKSVISKSGLPNWKSVISKSSAAADKPGVPAEQLVEHLSFTHFIELIQLDDSLKRAFYEAECYRGNWSVRELKRQIASLYYERAGLSKNKKKLSKLTQAKAEPQSAREIIRDPYVFEFLGLKPKEVMGESDLENALLDKLENFLLELGHGFCFEARQKRILIDGEHFFVDLVFYHRILKCHVLIELKADGFKHEHLGQLNTYVSWYGEHERAKGDNPPIGILLCTKKSHALVKYALAGIDNRLFVSKYQLELPKKEEIQRFIEEQIARAPGNVR
jgi:predicted nuclease of restriction endonuclease-like (RecB) superfamily